VDQAEHAAQLAACGLDAAGITDRVRTALAPLTRDIGLRQGMAAG
jgi:hypothetical protein